MHAGYAYRPWAHAAHGPMLVSKPCWQWARASQPYLRNPVRHLLVGFDHGQRIQHGRDTLRVCMCKRAGDGKVRSGIERAFEVVRVAAQPRMQWATTAIRASDLTENAPIPMTKNLLLSMLRGRAHTPGNGAR
eukprot:365990-Chlamydomonas_euryale.AAC.16